MRIILFFILTLLIGLTHSFSPAIATSTTTKSLGVGQMQTDTVIYNSITSLSTSAPAIGSAWFLSSMILSTYSNKAFLKYEPSSADDFSSRQKAMNGGPSVVIPSENETQTSYLSSILGKLSRPQLLTLYRFLGSSLMGIFLHVNLGGWSERLKLTLHYTHDFALPAIFLFIANHCNGIALDKIGISLTYTSKCIIPLATVLITVLIEGLGALPSVYALLTLIRKFLSFSTVLWSAASHVFNSIFLFRIAIATGVALASWKTPTFEKTGFTAAMLSSFSQAALNFTSKRALKKTGVSGLQAQGAMATVAFSLAIGMTAHTILRDRERKSSEKYVSEVSTCIIPPTWLTLLAISAYHLEYLLSFLFLKLVQPISFGTCDAIRRLGIIIAGRIMFGGEPFSKRNYLGMILAIFGAFSYSIASNLT